MYLLPATSLAFFALAGAALAQAPKPVDMNVYPALSTANPFDLNPSSTQSGPPGTIAMTSAGPSAAYSFKDMLANIHGYVEAGVDSRSGHNFSGGVTIPLSPRADLDLAASTGQVGGYKTPWGKTPVATYDTYSAGLHLHPTDDTDAYIGISGLHLNAKPGFYPYGLGYP